jgi:hypothetical protein
VRTDSNAENGGGDGWENGGGRINTVFNAEVAEVTENRFLFVNGNGLGGVVR